MQNSTGHVERRRNEDSQGNQDPGVVTLNPVVDESCAQSREVALGDEPESLGADTTAGPLASTVGSRRRRIMLVQKQRTSHWHRKIQEQRTC